MKFSQFTKLFALSLSFTLLCSFPTNATPAPSSPAQQTQGYPEILQQLARANIIYLGETHDRPADHEAQLKIIQELHRNNSKIAVALEMFQHPFQAVLNEYLAGNLTETQLIEQTEYERRWGFPWEYYAPILRFAKENKLPVLALNVPTEITRKVARQGLESLTPEEKQQIPPTSEIRTEPAAYRQQLLEIYQHHTTGGHGSSNNFERFFLAQVLWDETMADKIVQFVKANPDYQVIVLAGKGHIAYGYGIPSRVERRLGQGTVIQRSLLFSSPQETQGPGNSRIADFIWQHAQ